MSPTLEDINLTVKKGELVGILGRVGAGKVSTRLRGFMPQLILAPVKLGIGYCRRNAACRRRRGSLGMHILRAADSMVLSRSCSFYVFPHADYLSRIMSATIRDNIVFSYEYDETFYNLVLDACALRPDLALMPEGDMTEVGEKGITLSGGQRARISLARAVYARADL